MSWNDEKKTMFFKITEGEEKEFTISDIVEKKAPEESKINNLSGKDHYYELHTDLGVYTLNNWGLFFALQNNSVTKGDRVSVKYVKKGAIGRPSLFEVRVIERGNPEVPF